MNQSSQTNEIKEASDTPTPFSKRLEKLLTEGMNLLKKCNCPSYQWLQQGEMRLRQLGTLLDEYPSLHQLYNDDPLQQGPEAIIETLCELNPLELKLRLPSKAVLAESYWMLKSQHLKGMQAAIHDLKADLIPRGFRKTLHREISRMIHIHLLAQLLIDVILNPGVPGPLKQAAASNLIDLWDQSAQQETLSDFFRMINSLWDARAMIQVQYGTLLGTAELMQLLEAECDPVVLDFFLEPTEREEEAYAFQEFLFALTYEEIKLLRAYMEEKDLSVIGHDVVEQVLPDRAERPPFGQAAYTDPHKIYRSYKRRRSQARYRTSSDQPGPRHTAEQFLVLHLLRAQQDPS